MPFPGHTKLARGPQAACGLKTPGLEHQTESKGRLSLNLTSGECQNLCQTTQDRTQTKEKQSQDRISNPWPRQQTNTGCRVTLGGRNFIDQATATVKRCVIGKNKLVTFNEWLPERKEHCARSRLQEVNCRKHINFLTFNFSALLVEWKMSAVF